MSLNFNTFLDFHYGRKWNMFCQKPSKDHKRNTEYLMRYVKRPVIANSRLLHYSGQDVLFRYFNHIVTIKLRHAVNSVRRWQASSLADRAPDQPGSCPSCGPNDP